MGDRTSGPDRFDVEATVPVAAGPIPVPGVGPTIGVEVDNVQKSTVPADLVAARGGGEATEAGVRTEWTAASLDDAIRWLEAHAEFANRMAHQMADLQDLMGGPAGGMGGKSPLGGFDWAVRLSQKHNGLYSSTEAAMKRLSDDLYNAADALRTVKENYDNAEGANRMSAADMLQAFGNAARGPQA